MDSPTPYRVVALKKQALTNVKTKKFLIKIMTYRARVFKAHLFMGYPYMKIDIIPNRI